MKTVKPRILQLFLPLMLVMVGVVSCKEDDEEMLALQRQFMPAGAIASKSGETSVQLTWKEALFTTGDATYTVEVAKDTLFETPVIYTATTDTAAITLTDENLEIKQIYFARVKTNGTETVPESKWLVSSRFTIRGEQIFLPIVNTEVKDKTVVLRWRVVPNLSKIVFTPASGAPVEVALTETEAEAGEKLITGLSANTLYTAEIFAGNKSKGTVKFTTKEPSIFSIEVSPADDLAAIIANAASGDVIGLAPGTYDLTADRTIILQKTITLQSISGNPSNTKILFKEITLRGTGAGVKLSGIEFDGNAADADYFLNITGLNSDGEAATFTNIIVENSLVHGTNNCFLRGNRGGNNAHKIDMIKVDNTIVYDNGDSYTFFTMDKMEFKTLLLTNSTFYDIGRAFIGWATNISVSQKPNILINNCTFNNFGSSGRNRILVDANANIVDFTIQNSIIANTPKPGASIGSDLLRITGAGSTVKFENNNYFNMNGGDPLAPLNIPSYVQTANNLTIDLGWTATTTDFTLPAGSPLRTASKTGGPIGDLRWAF